MKTRKIEFEPANNKTYNTTYATSEDWDQPAQSSQILRWSHVPFTAFRLSKEG